MSQLKKLLGKRIKELRRARNMTQEKLSELTNIGTSSISKIENGIYHPNDKNLENIAQALNVEPYELYICGHNKDIEDLKQDISSKLENASNEEIKIVYKILAI